MEEFLYKEYVSLFSFFNKAMIFKGLKLNLFRSLDKYVSRYFQNPEAKKILEYAMVFLGNSPGNAPALYSIMSHIDLNLGVWFPEGGMRALVKAMMRLAAEANVQLVADAEVSRLEVEQGRVRRVFTAKEEYTADIVISNADLHHTETALLEKQYRSYPEPYWKKKVMAPSMLLLLPGINRKLPQLVHHNLYFAADWNHHFNQIFRQPAWPDQPCYYVSCTSKTDSKAAPPG